MSAIVPFVGRHLVPDEPPPPKAKPPYRFLLAMAGIVVLAIVAMALVAALYPERGPAVADSGQRPVPGAPPPPPTQTPPVAVTSAPGQPPPTQTQPAGQPPPPTTATTPPAPGTVTGGYAVTHTDAEWGNKFEVRLNLSNSSGTAQPWVVTLEYPDRVTSFGAAWTDPGQAAPQQIVNQPLFTLNGSQPIPPGSSLTVWIQFNVGPGAPVTLLSCRVNGSACQQF